ncbi:hypothetical protein PRIPAC_94651 [Pristionchus pacificus]|nr:hypothetical protein PRIPAC_94651 [Pristionchus pacificus]
MIPRLRIPIVRSISSHLGAINSNIRQTLGDYAVQRRDNLSVKPGTYATTEWADASKMEEAMQLAEQFLAHEPQSVALSMGPSETRPLLEHLVAKCLHTPYSIIVYDKENGKPLGIRLTSVAHRDGSLDADPIPLKIESPRVRTFWEAIEKMQRHFWATYLDVDRVLRHEIAFVAPCYQRAGIATRMLEFGLDANVLVKEHNFDGIVVESTCESSHSILGQNGFSWSLKLTQEEYRDEQGKMLDIKLSPHDDLRLYYKQLRKDDDTPYYARMWP